MDKIPHINAGLQPMVPPW